MTYQGTSYYITVKNHKAQRKRSLKTKNATSKPYLWACTSSIILPFEVQSCAQKQAQIKKKHSKRKFNMLIRFLLNKWKWTNILITQQNPTNFLAELLKGHIVNFTEWFLAIS